MSYRSLYLQAGRRSWTALLLAVAFVSAVPANAQMTSSISGGATSARYMVFKTQPDGSVRVVFSTRVELSGPLAGRPSISTTAATNRNTDEIRLRLEDAQQTVIFEDTVEIPRWIRGEFHGDGPGASGEFTIDRHFVLESAPAFVVRVPDIAGTTLTLDSAAFASSTARFDLDAVDAIGTFDANQNLIEIVPPPQPAPLPGWNNGSPANRLDLLIMGDGYTAAQQTKFETDARNLANTFFSITPYAEYKNYVNVWALFTASAQSGVDQPAYNSSCSQYSRVQTCCSDPDANGVTARTVTTVFGGTFCSYNTQRLATVDDALVLSAAAAQPNWDKILVLVNSNTYGGSGGSIGVVSTDTSAVAVAQHEFGHSFTGLADEYEASFSYPACSDLPGSAHSACEPNVTDQTSRALVKWVRWISPSQPVPSTAAPSVVTAAGLWRGARYLATGMYRQGYACLMRYLETPFCDVAAEAYALRLYQGGWGAPSLGIENIEPGSESPAPGSLSAAYPGGSYQATVLGPQVGPTVTAEWRLDGVLVRTQSVATGGIASHALAASAGSHSLELRVTDKSPIVHSTMRAGVASNRTWTITVTKATTSSTITTISPSPSVIGLPITVTAAVNVIAPGAGTPSGKITVSDGSVSCEITLPATSCSLTPIGLGPKTLTATYAGDANFIGSVSAGIVHSVVEPGLPPTLQSVSSRKVHGAAGAFSLPVSLLNTNPTTEPRAGPAQTLVFNFDKPIVGATATLSEGAATLAAPAFSGSDVIVGLTGVTDGQYVTVVLTNLVAADGGAGGSATVRVGFLLGDASQNRVVTLADVGQVNAQLAQQVTAANYLKDVNASGTLSLADKAIANTQLTKTLPAP